MKFGYINENPFTEQELKALEQEIVAAVENKNWEEAFTKIQKTVYEHGTILTCFLFAIDQIDYVSTKLIEENKVSNNRIEQNFLNLLGIVSYYLNERKDSLNFYVLGLLKEESGEESTYLQNIGTSLMLLGEYSSAIKYLKLAITYLPTIKDSKKKKYSHTLYQLNLVQALVKKGDIKEAFSLIKKIDEAELNSAMINRKQLLKTICEINELKLDDEASLNKLSSLEVKLRKEENFNTLSSLLEYKYENYPSLTKVEREQILLDRYHLNSDNINVLINDDITLKLIEFYDEFGNEDLRNKYSYQLYKSISARPLKSKRKLTLIFLRFYTNFFNGLKLKNSVNEQRKNELEDITYILSHDLVTPVRIISSFSQLLKSDEETNLSLAGKEYLEYIENSNNRLNAIISNLKVLKEIDEKQELKADVDLNNIVTSTKEILKEVLKNKRATIELKNDLPTIKIKPNEVRILFRNLIENGIKFNHSEQPKIEIEFNSVNDQIKISFTDNGIGIKEEYKQQIFSYFKKLHTANEFDGTGFGLGLCNRIMAAYNGKIDVDSASAQGSKFTLIFPKELMKE